MKRIALVGSGPASLMAATVLAQAGGAEVHLFERRSGFGRKLLIAGSSGLNISHSTHSISDFAKHYSGFSEKHWEDCLNRFGQKEWISFIENELKLKTFLGTSDRYFVEEMKASGLLKTWIEYLESKGVHFHSKHELTNFESRSGQVTLEFNGVPFEGSFDKAVLGLGGGSWEPETPSWVKLFESKTIRMIPFTPSNVGYEVAWSKAFLKEAEGKPLKKIEFSNAKGKKLGELMVTSYGLEGTPVYFLGEKGEAFIDLKPEFSERDIIARLMTIKENLSPIRRVKKGLKLCEASQALLFHHLSEEQKSSLESLAHAIKHFRVELLRPRPLLEAISSQGGVALDEVTESYELKKFPKIYCIGEMLDWDAPTGGFLIQACVSQGASVFVSATS